MKMSVVMEGSLVSISFIPLKPKYSGTLQEALAFTPPCTSKLELGGTRPGCSPPLSLVGLGGGVG